MVGFTGVVWFPRGATVNSLALFGGPGPVPMSAASAAWSDLAAVLAEADAEVGATIAALAATWEGAAADAACTGLAGFGAWLAESAGHAGEMAAAGGAVAAAYSAAALVMPGPAEIAATKAAEAAVTVAAAPTGAGLGATAAAAEAAEREMDIRAAMAMDGYEAASTVLSEPVPFRPAPPIAIPEHRAAAFADTVVQDVVRSVGSSPGRGTGPVADYLASGPVHADVLRGGARAAADAATRAAGYSAYVGPIAHPGPAGAAAAPVSAAGVQPAAGAVSASGTAPGPVPSAHAPGAGGPAAPAGAAARGRGPGALRAAGGVGAVGNGGEAGFARVASGRTPLTEPGSPEPPVATRTANTTDGAGTAVPRAAVPGRLGGAGTGAVHDEDGPERRYDRIDDGRLVVPAVLGGMPAGADASGGGVAGADASGGDIAGGAGS